MILCPTCRRITPRGEPTGTFTIYREKKYANGTVGTEAESQERVCVKCKGEKGK